MSDTNEQMQATAHIDASPAEVFAFLCDPANHQRTEPTDWVRDAITAEPITGAGQLFGVHMYLKQVGGHYDMHNLVTEFETDRTIAWLPGTLDDEGTHQPGGWWWRYDIEPADASSAATTNTGTTDTGTAADASAVTLTYDWNGTPAEFREQVGGMPPFPPKYLDNSLAELKKALES